MGRLQPDHAPEQEQDRRGRPGLRRARAGVRHRHRRLVAGDPREQLGRAPGEPDRGVEGTVHDPIDDVPTPVPGRSGRADRGVVRPHRPVVVAERVVGAHRRGQRADAPPGPHARSDQLVEVPLRTVVVGDPRPERMSRVRGEGVDPSALAVQGHDVPAALVPERLVEPVPQRRWQRGEVLRPVAEPHRRAELGGASVARRTRSPAPRRARWAAGSGPVREGDPVPGVLPSLVGQAGGVLPLVVEEPVAVRVGGPEHPAERGVDRRAELLEVLGRRARPTGAPLPRA